MAWKKSFYKLSLLAAALLLLAGVSRLQWALNRQRENPQLGLIRSADLGTNAPPVLAFTTVALGSFRGLIANALWMRATDLQDQGKYFEMVQLADWITKLEPHFVQVWLVQAWNMAYNISVKFTSPADRWRWVQNGIRLLRDGGLRYNPKATLIYRELGWFFQHKMGQNMDDAHVFYKLAWLTNMTEALGPGRPNFEALIQPQSEDDRRRAQILVERYKLQPEYMKEVDAQYGPLEWRLPMAHAIYWGYVGLKHSDKKELITLRRLIYQSMHLEVLQGRLIQISSNVPPAWGPNLNLVNRANAAYEQMIEEETELKPSVKTAHLNFLRQVIYLLYSHNRLQEAQRYFKLVRDKYPDTLPSDVGLEQYAMEMFNLNITKLNQNQTRAVIEGLLQQSFVNRALDEDDQADGSYLLARRLHELYEERVRASTERIGLQPFPAMAKTVVDGLLDPQRGLTPDLAARLRTKLNLPAPSASEKK